MVKKYILRHPVVLEDVCKQGPRSLKGRRETGQREETTGLRKTIHNDQDHGDLVKEEDRSGNQPTGATTAVVERVRVVTYLWAGA